MRAQALFSVLSKKYSEKEILFVDSLEVKNIKTVEALNVLKNDYSLILTIVGERTKNIHYEIFNERETLNFQYYIDSFLFHNKNNIFYQTYGNKTYYLFVDNLVLAKTYGKDVSYSVYKKAFFLNKYYNEQKH